MHSRQDPGQLAQLLKLPVDGAYRRQAFEPLPGLREPGVLFGNRGQVRSGTPLVEDSHGKTRETQA